MRLFPSSGSGTRRPPAGTQINHAHPAARGLVAAYAFNENSGLYVNDDTGHGYGATLTGPPPWTGVGETENGDGLGGLKFNGSSTYGTIPYNELMKCRLGWTACATITCGTSSPAEQWIFVSYNLAGAWNWALYIKDFGEPIRRPRIFIHDGTDFTTLDSTTVPLAIGRTYRIVGTADGVNIRLFVDGAQVASTASTRLPGGVGAGPFHFGASPTSFATGYHNGNIHQLLLYDRALHPEEVAEDARRPWAAWDSNEPFTKYFLFATADAGTSGTVALSRGVGAVAIDVDPVISGTVAATRGTGVVAVDVTNAVTGDVALTRGSGDVAIDGTSTITGTVAATRGAGAVAIDGDPIIDADVALTRGAGAVAIDGDPIIDADVALTRGAGAVAIDAAATVEGDVALSRGVGAVAIDVTSTIDGDVALSRGPGVVSILEVEDDTLESDDFFLHK